MAGILVMAFILIMVFTQPNLVTYQESHDEERLMFKNEQYGAGSGSYNVKKHSYRPGEKRNGCIILGNATGAKNVMGIW